ncbi:MAG: hypothetical protein IKH75_18625 [Ruminococcus sp.]|nr:hypothetical protein [Ruminococcus sp.]
MKCLIVDDNIDAVKGIKDFLEDREDICQICDFEDFKKHEFEFEPDIIVLDLKDDADQINAGDQIFDRIISKRFIPTIIFSAIAETYSVPDEVASNPFIEVLSKGDEEDVIKCIYKWIPYIEAVNSFKEQINASFKESLKALGNFINLGSKPDDSVMKYMLNKRANQYFDDDNCGEKPPAWIEYLYPPVKKHLLVADILRKISEEADLDKIGQPEEYAIILTPSCDMANTQETIKILIANCKAKELFTDMPANECKPENAKQIKRVSSMLNAGYNKSKVALAELPSVIPYCTVDLKSLDQVLSSEIALSKEEINDNHKYYRVASVNSPFREQIVWAHMINSCRPGMPNRDMETWAKGILT